jgi:uncharacterized protein YdbL (DUF1318 family)
MGRAARTLAGGLAFLLAACVTVNIYFPAAAAEKAADRVIQEVWGAPPRGQPPAGPDGPGEGTAPGRPGPTSLEQHAPGAGLARLADFFLTPALAQPNIDVSTSAIQQITAGMERRHRQLEPLYASGAVGLTSDGLVALRDPGAVPLAQRRDASQLVADENRDRQALYREVAVANGHPEWEAQIRATFARRWIANARSGWWHQDVGGQWVRR